MVPVERVLTEAHLNRAVLARQGLLARWTGSLVSAVERMGGVQNQYAVNGYVALWSRLAGFERDDLTRALERRQVIQGTLMRATIHLVSRRDYPLLAAGVRRDRAQGWLRAASARGLREDDVRAGADVVGRLLAEGPRPRAELVGALVAAGISREHWEGIGLFVDLVRVPPSGTWDRRRADLYALADHWLPTPRSPARSTGRSTGQVGSAPAAERAGHELLVRRYLGAFGPAPLADVANWAGVPAPVLEPAAERLDLRRFRSTTGQVLLDLPRAPRPSPRAEPPVRFLPTWDAVLLVHARRTGVLPEDYRPLVFHTRNPQSVPTFLVDGRVAGTWRHHEGRVTVEPFAPIPLNGRRALEVEADALRHLYRQPGRPARSR